MAAQVGGVAHLYNLVAERQEEGLAATAVSVLAAGSLLGRLAGGVLASRMSMRLVAIVLMEVQALALLLLSTNSSRTGLVAATVLFGLTVGNPLTLHPLLLAERFGVRDHPRIYSRSQLVATAGIAAGPATAGALHDALQRYGAAFAVIALGSVLAGAVLCASGRRTTGRTHEHRSPAHPRPRSACRRCAMQVRDCAGCAERRSGLGCWCACRPTWQHLPRTRVATRLGHRHRRTS